MQDWESVRASHIIEGEEYEGHRVLWAEAFGKRFKVIDTLKVEATNRGTYDGPCAAVFYEEEPMFHHVGTLKSGDVFIDVGANIGSYSVPAAALGAKVYAFEPGNSCLDVLCANAVLNEFPIVIDPVFIGDGQELPSYILDDVVHDSDIVLPRTLRLDPFADDVGNVTMIKIDVEGLEWHVIQGAKQIIEQCKPTLLIEDHDSIAPGNPVSDYPASINSSLNIIEYLHSIGYGLELTACFDRRKFICAKHPTRK